MRMVVRKSSIKQRRIIPALALTLFTALGGSVAGAQPLLNLQAGIELRWPTTTNNTYQPQWSSNPSGVWSALGAAVPGNGATNSLYDAAASGARTYQVLEMVPGSAPSAA